MLNALRKGAATWVAKIFIGLLVLSFAVWGIADIFGGYGNTSVATVGNIEISGQEYQRVLRGEMRSFSARLGRSMTMAEARALGLDRQVLQRMIGDAAVESQGADLNLGISDKAIAEIIKNQDLFKDATGRFNEQIFRQILQNNGLNEAGYVARQRRASIRAQILQTVSESGPLPKALLGATNVYRNEQRVLKFVDIPVSILDAIETPTEETLRTHYDKTKRSHMAPEYRNLGILALTVDTIGDRIEISEADMMAYYEDRKQNYITPEKRRILQITFPDKAAAQAGYDKIKAGTDFLALAEERGFKEADIDLGLVRKSDLADTAIADAAFALEKDAVSEPVVSPLATVLLKVTAIEPEVVQSYEQVKADIRKTLVTEKAVDEILELSESVEELRDEDATLKEIAEKIGVKYLEVANVDRQGNDLNNVAVSPLPGGDALLRAAFDAGVGDQNDVIETNDRGLVWFIVNEVTPERQKTFEEVREAVAKAWRDSEERSRIAKRTQELLDQAKGGKSLADIASELSLEVKEAKPVTRLAPGSDVPQAAVAQAFTLSENGLGSAPAQEGNGRVLFQVVKIVTPDPLDADKSKQLEEVLVSSVREDFINQYVAGVRGDLSIDIDQQVFDRVTGRSSDPAQPRGSF